MQLQQRNSTERRKHWLASDRFTFGMSRRLTASRLRKSQWSPVIQESYTDRLKSYVAQLGIALEYSSDIAPAKGVSHGGKITLLPNLSPAEAFSTLVHEVGSRETSSNGAPS